MVVFEDVVFEDVVFGGIDCLKIELVKAAIDFSISFFVVVFMLVCVC